MFCSISDLSKSHVSTYLNGIAISTSSEITNFFDDSSPSAKSVQGRFHRYPAYYIPAGLNSMNSPYLATNVNSRREVGCKTCELHIEELRDSGIEGLRD
jgi:hypothetical protein